MHIAKTLSTIICRGGVCCVLLFVSHYVTAQSDPLEKVLKVAQQNISIAQASQKRIDKIANDTKKSVDEYHRLLKSIEGLKIHNGILLATITNQKKRLSNYEKSIREATIVQRQIPSIALKMLNTLENFIELDAPLYIEERRQRIAHLRRNMNLSGISIGEKFRQVLEAYKIEINEYGRKISTYKTTLNIDGNPLDVNMLQIGRIALIYQTIDGRDGGIWDAQARQWMPLDSSYLSSTRKALRIARKQAAIDILQIPVSAPEEFK